MNINDIHVNPDNPRLIKDDKFKKLVASIKDFPKMMELRPLVVDDTMTILGGNMRYNALREAGFSEIPDNWVKKAEKLTLEQKKEFIIKDNLPFGEWDWDILANNFEIKDLLEWGFDEKDLKIEQDIEEDEAPEVSDEPAVSKLGEVYQLGRHRLMCGDSTKIEDVEKLMDGKKADMVFTDPPYGIDFVPEEELSKLGKLENDTSNYEDFTNFLKGWIPNMFGYLKDGGVYYICMGWEYAAYMIDLIKRKMDNRVKQVIIWDRMMPTLHGFPQDFNPVYECIMYGWKKGANRLMTGGVNGAEQKNNIWRFERLKAKDEIHTTEKPVTLVVNALKCSSNTGEVILDLFAGSGVTGIACEQTNRICFMAEIDCKYADVIRKRWAKYVYPDRWEKEWENLTPIVKQ